ncbi:hypothetical protein J1N35_023098 [Gossypium stocksii]|uniref:Uncharacterized protein n=1 Tax=Gossypium stocksii TaxID=47602 RepID=A0A9D3VJG5_9ROSI|nr:hypothetical protein J1N35_023098 [Gossypium stocksii]
METAVGRGRKNSRSRDILSALESRVVPLEECMGEMKETLEAIEVYMAKAFSSNMDTLQALLNIDVGKLIENNDALEARMIAMKEEN